MEYKMNRAEILKTILNNKSDISDNSARVYVATLASLAKNFEWTDIKFFTTKSKEILKYLDTLTPTRRKAMLCALIAIVNNKKVVEAYKKKMLDVSSECREEESKQQKSEKEEENWESWDTVLKVYHELEEEALPLFKKDKLTSANLKTLQHYIILSCYVLIPPRRIADFIHFKIKDIDPKVDNWFDEKTNELVFNNYKTAKNYGTQRVECPESLQAVFRKWVPVASRYSEYLLFNSYGNHLTQPQLTKMLNAIFGKNISASMLRHIYVSDVTLKNVPKLSELEKVAHDMGHSTTEQMLYKKF
jgi:integrase